MEVEMSKSMRAAAEVVEVGNMRVSRWRLVDLWEGGEGVTSDRFANSCSQKNY